MTYSPSAASLGLVRGGELAHTELRRAGPRGPPRRTDPRGRARAAPRAARRAVASTSHARVAPLGAALRACCSSRTAPRRAASRRCAATSSPTSATSSRRRSARSRCWPRRCSTPPTTRRRCTRFAGRMQHEATRLARLVQELIDLSRLQGADPLPEPDAGRPSTRSSARPSTGPGSRPRPSGIAHRRVGDAGAPGAAATRSSWSTAVRNLLDNAVAYSPSGTRVAVARPPRATTSSRSRSPTRASASPRRAGPDLRALLPGRPGPVRADRRHRPRAGDRQAHRQQPRRRRSRSGASEGQGSTFTIRLPPQHGRRRTPHRRACVRTARHVPRDPTPGGWHRDDPRPGRRGRGVLLRRAVLHAAQGGLRGRGRRDRARRAGGVRPRRRRPRAARPDAARACPGTEVCRAAAADAPHVPVIMLTAKDGEVDKVVGLELGADDYVTKPYSPRELVARIRAVLRRGAEPRTCGRRRSRPVRCGWTSSGTSSPSTARRVAAAAEGVRAARDAAAQRRPGAHPRCS